MADVMHSFVSLVGLFGRVQTGYACIASDRYGCIASYRTSLVGATIERGDLAVRLGYYSAGLSWGRDPVFTLNEIRM